MKSVSDKNSLLKRAEQVVSEYDEVGVSLLQRRLSVDYATAKKLVSALENEGVLKPIKDSMLRKVVIKANKGV